MYKQPEITVTCCEQKVAAKLGSQRQIWRRSRAICRLKELKKKSVKEERRL